MEIVFPIVAFKYIHNTRKNVCTHAFRVHCEDDAFLACTCCSKEKGGKKKGGKQETAGKRNCTPREGDSLLNADLQRNGQRKRGWRVKGR